MASRFKRVDSTTMEEVVNSNPLVGVLFCSAAKCANSEALLRGLDKVTTSLTLLAVVDEDEAADFGVDGSELPALVIFCDGIPVTVFPVVSTRPEAISRHLLSQSRCVGRPPELSRMSALTKIARQAPALLLVFVEHAEEENHSLDSLSRLTKIFPGMKLATVVGKETSAALIGSRQPLPGFIMFRRGIPTLLESSNVSKSVLDHLNEDIIPEVSEELLQYAVEAQEYLAVLFKGPCDIRAKTDGRCQAVQRDLQATLHDLENVGVPLVATPGTRQQAVAFDCFEICC